MEYIDLRKVNRGELKQIRRRVVHLKKMGKIGKEIEELTGVWQSRASEIWTAYQREGDNGCPDMALFLASSLDFDCAFAFFSSLLSGSLVLSR